MKRWITSVLTLLLLLGVMGCAKQPDPATPPVHPPTPPTPPHAALTLAETLAGTYRCVESGEADGEKTDICILPLGGLLLVENVLHMNGSPMSYWAQEIWPEDMTALQSAESELRGVNLCFSGMSNDGEYWDAAMDVIVSPTEQGVTLTDVQDDYRAENVYERIENGVLFHNDLPAVQAMLAQGEGTPALMQPVELLGVWCASGDGYAARLSFGADGTMTYALKEKGRPITVLFGAWGAEENELLHVLAERFGYGTMPYQWELVYSQGAGQLRLLDISGDINFPLPPVIEPYFVPAEENWCFPAELF